MVDLTKRPTADAGRTTKSAQQIGKFTTMSKRDSIPKSLMNARIYKLTPQQMWDAIYNHPRLHWRLHFLELRQDNCGNLYIETNIWNRKTSGVITGDKTLDDVCHWLWLAVPQYMREVVASNKTPKIAKIMAVKAVIPPSAAHYTATVGY